MHWPAGVAPRAPRVRAMPDNGPDGVPDGGSDGSPDHGPDRGPDHGSDGGPDRSLQGHTPVDRGPSGGRDRGRDGWPVPVGHRMNDIMSLLHCVFMSPILL